MGVADNELLDSAMDAAEAKMAEAVPQVDPIEEAKEVETFHAPSKAAEEPAEKPDKEKDLSDQEEPSAETGEEVAEEPPLAASTVKPPAFWSAKQKEVFLKLPPEAQQVIADRELEQTRALSRLGNEAGKAKDYDKRFYADFETPEAAQNHRNMLAAQGVTDPIAELHRYRAWDRVLNSDPRTAIAALMQRNGLTPQHFTDEDFQEQEERANPHVDELRAEIEALKQAREQEKIQQEDAVRRQSVNAWKEGKDSFGVSRKSFAEKYSFQVSQEFEKVMAERPGTDMLEALTEAYENAKRDVYGYHGLPLGHEASKQKTPEEIVAENKKRQAASFPTTGAPKKTQAHEKPRLKGKNDSEKIGNAVDRAFDRVEAGRGAYAR